MTFQHKTLSEGRWYLLSFCEQMANIGSEVFRAISWKPKDDVYSKKATDRALELLCLTIDDKRNIKRLKELTRLYEVLVDYFYFDNQYGSSDDLWQKYFMAFTYAAQTIKLKNA